MDGGEYSESLGQTHGLRLRRHQLSVNMRGYTFTYTSLTDKELVSFAFAYNKLLDALREQEPYDEFSGPILSEADFPDQSGSRIFKFVTPDVWTRFLSLGSFRLASPLYYQRIEHESLRDHREGNATIVFEGSDQQVLVGVEVGANSAVLCGTRPPPLNASLMRERFGQIILEIQDPIGFSAEVCKRIGATRFSIRDVVYSDVRIFRKLLDLSSLVREFSKSQTDTPELLRTFNQTLFHELHTHSLIAGTFCKPSVFSVERERRISFEFPHDISGETIAFTAPELIKHFRIIHDIHGME